MIFNDYLGDGTVAIGMATLLFFLPSKKPMFLSTSGQFLILEEQ